MHTGRWPGEPHHDAQVDSRVGIKLYSRVFGRVTLKPFDEHHESAPCGNRAGKSTHRVGQALLFLVLGELLGTCMALVRTPAVMCVPSQLVVEADAAGSGRALLRPWPWHGGRCRRRGSAHSHRLACGYATTT